MDRELELELVARLRTGDAGAFDAVHEAFNGRLYNFLARLSSRREVAEDLVDETWLRFVLHAGRLRADTYLDRWLFTVARNLYVSYCRSRQLEDSHVAGMIGLWPYGRTERSPLESVEATAAKQRVATALASLPLIYREALLLVGIESLPYAEAARICSITAETMRQRVHRGRALLAQRLADEGGPGCHALKEITT